VVLRVFAIGRAHQATDRQIEARRAILPLVVPVGDERPDAVWDVIMTQDMGDHAVDRGVAATAFFVGHPACIAEAGKDEAVDDMSDLVLVASQPSE
jgi:hypothetical protein